METFGGLHVAFNNAGIVMTAPFSEITEDMASKVFDINLKSLVFCFKYQVRIHPSTTYLFAEMHSQVMWGEMQRKGSWFKRNPGVV